jgi:hypothetical protein
MAADILRSKFALPEEVTILGSGSYGKPFWPSLSGYIISVNKAVLFHGSDLWMSWATGYWRFRDTDEYKWWYDAEKVKVTRAFGSWPGGGLVEETAEGLKPGGGLAEKCVCSYKFRYAAQWEDEPRGFKEGYLCRGGTISMAALQLCHFKGVKRVILCGCDFYGYKYADGTYARVLSNNASLQAVKVARNWPDLKVANEIVAACTKRGMRIESVSPTALKV